MNTQSPIPDDLISPTKAAQILGLHVATLYRWIFRGKLPGWKLGRKILVSRADLAGMVEPIVPRNGQPRKMSVVDKFAEDQWLRKAKAEWGL